MHTKVLKESFADIIRIDQIKDRRIRINLWLLYHLHVISLSHRLNFLAKKCMGIYSFVAAMLFGCIVNQIYNKENISGAVITFFGFFGSIFLLCQAGEKIAQQNKDITDAVYHSLWYMTDIKTRKDIIFILMSSNITLQLQALPLGQVNFALLLMIMKGAFSYLTLLQNSA
ncbi:uncharacterized protein LOC126889578 [Diabrotica virgifera virgifera]|uniref:Uncharacterized protein n=1 Tax=Diabrotica virgifera virgifera TaxID=50390 RepID=A0ABM5KUR7_DIAVI|nr:uncharacterized protein LOC126889578 [Diabrotica virgifera virgifera]